MSWKFVCNLWFHEDYSNSNLQADNKMKKNYCLKIVVCINFMKTKVADKLPWHQIYKSNIYLFIIII